ncbi:MAG TPA: histidine phosphatase family protein [Candidatus Dormibacteraeota bacterium]|nr:histidine phosphatase family protein [Candidatus Dormibacteraeota bacterium]
MHPARPARPRGSCDRERGPLLALGASRDDGQARLSLELYIARHGETEWSASGRHTGKTDLPLTPAGEEKARALRPRLAQVHFDAVFSSPLQRARRTAELAGFDQPRITPLLAEVDYGDYEGLTSVQIHEANPSWQVYSDGCPGGESPMQIHARALEFIALASESGSHVLAFAHGHILRAVGAAFIRADIKVAAGLMLDVATLSILRDDGHRMITLWNAL